MMFSCSLLLVDRQALSEHTTTSSSTESLGQALRVSLVKPGAYLSESYNNEGFGGRGSPGLFGCLREVKQNLQNLRRNRIAPISIPRLVHLSAPRPHCPGATRCVLSAATFLMMPCPPWILFCTTPST